jgi:hypothetical protein
MNCIYCNFQQPDKGFFCPNCFKQVKCKHCSEVLLKEAKICVFCGEDVGQKNSATNLNTIEFSETETERNFKASFTDTVGQSISESFGMILTNKIGSKKHLATALPISTVNLQQTEMVETDAEIVVDSKLKTTAEHEPKDIPTLKDVKLRDLAKNETDWLLVYMYYASEGGTKEFTRENIIQLYKDTGRRTDSRINGLSQYFKSISKALYIKSTNDKDFILLEKGKNKVLEVFKGNSSARIEKKSYSKNNLSSAQKPDENIEVGPKSKKTKTTNTIGFVDLKLSHAEQKLLTDFFENKRPRTQNEKVIVAMRWFIDYKKIDEVSMEEINYLLSIASETPSALAQVLGNIVGSKFRWVIKGSVGKYQLSSIGESYIMNKLPK